MKRRSDEEEHRMKDKHSEMKTCQRSYSNLT